MKGTLEERFWSKVGSANEDGCRMWQAKRANGYGKFSVGHRTVSAHRLAYELYYGTYIPEGKIICHKCDNRACCEPSHLYIGTYSDNMTDRLSRNPYNLGGGQPKFYAGEIWLIRKLKVPDGKQGMRIKYKFSARYVAKMFKASPKTVLGIWNSKNYICREGYLV